MKNNDLVTIATVALGTATLTVLLFGSASLEAGNDGPPPTAKIAKPKLVSHGIEFTLATPKGQTFKTGDEPVFELTAINSTSESAETLIRLMMSATAPANPVSRLLPMPAMLWQDEQQITLKPNETKVISVSTHTKLPANKLIAVALQETDSQPQTAPVTQPQVSLAGLRPSLLGSRGITALTFSTIPPSTAPALAATH